MNSYHKERSSDKILHAEILNHIIQKLILNPWKKHKIKIKVVTKAWKTWRQTAPEGRENFWNVSSFSFDTPF